MSSLCNGCCKVQFDDGSFVEEAVNAVARHLVGQQGGSRLKRKAACTATQPIQEEEICSICLSTHAGVGQVGVAIIRFVQRALRLYMIMCWLSGGYGVTLRACLSSQMHREVSQNMLSVVSKAL